MTLDALHSRGVEFQCITMRIDTSTPKGRKWFRDTASGAEYERELISQRTKAGQAAARRKGKHIGRPRKLTDGQVKHTHEIIASGQASISRIASDFGVNKSTLSRALQRKIFHN